MPAHCKALLADTIRRGQGVGVGGKASAVGLILLAFHSPLRRQMIQAPISTGQRPGNYCNAVRIIIEAIGLGSESRIFVIMRPDQMCDSAREITET